MKTSGIIRTWTAFVLPVLACCLAHRSTAQIYSASRQNVYASSPRGNNYLAVADETKPVKPELRSLNRFLLTSFNDTRAGKTHAGNDNNAPASAFNFDEGGDNIYEINFRATRFRYPVNSRTDIGVAEFSADMLMIYAKSLKDYAKKNGFDTSYAFLSNMGMLCNRKRFFLVNLTTMKIEQSGLVSHGRGQGPTIYDKQYSNARGSRCTALGRYKILGKYKGSYGQAYKMNGLDSTNCNALERNIVLHSMSCIPDIENLFPACVSDGCPAVSAKFLASIRKVIDTRKKPMLLWIFDSNLEEPVIRSREAVHVPVVSSPGCPFEITAIHSDRQLHDLVRKRVRRNHHSELASRKKKKPSNLDNSRNFAGDILLNLMVVD